MKYLAWIGGILSIFATTVYGVFFTPLGNSLIKPIVENKIQEQTKLESKLTKFSLSTSDFEIVLALNENNSIKIKGDYSLFSRTFDFSYEVALQKLESLEPFMLTPLRGVLYTNGTVKGNMAFMKVNGISDLASSNTLFEAVLKDFELASLRAKIENLDIEKLLFILKQPHYTDGLLFMNMDISDARSDNLDGKITTKITKGLLNSNYLAKAYEFKSAMLTTTFDSVITTMLNKSVADSKVDFNSNIVNIDIKSAKFDIKDGSLKSDYTVNIADLNRLFFITNQHLRGALSANGEFSKAKDLDFTMHTNIAEGKIDAKLHNDDFYADISSVKTKKMLYMFLYPDMLDATLNAKVNYDLTQSRGTFNGQVANAKFEKNQPFDLVKQYVNFDMYKEFFSGDINAKIYKENVLASLDLRSIEASIKIKEAKINTKTKQIDSDITLQSKKNVVSAALNGDIDAPRVSINLEEFMKTEAGKEVQEKISKEADKLFKKLLK